jgi:large subunit ribosomal protein L9
MMKIILQEDVPNLGVVGDLVQVKDGYARNYLIPQGKAVFASVRSIKELEHQQRIADHRREQATAEAQGVKGRIEGLSITMEAKVAPPQVDDEGEPIVEALPKLFGSVTNRDLSRALADSDIKVDHRRIVLKAPVRSVGKYEARIRLDGAIEAKLPFWVVPAGIEDVEAEKQRIEAALEAEREAAEQAAAAAEAAKQAPAAVPEAEAAPTEDATPDETQAEA